MLALASTCSRQIAHNSFLPSRYFQIPINQLAALLTECCISIKWECYCLCSRVMVICWPLHREMQHGELDITHQEETLANQLTINVEAERSGYWIILAIILLVFINYEYRFILSLQLCDVLCEPYAPVRNVTFLIIGSLKKARHSLMMAF